jgi:hypothetical protein
MAQEQVRHSLTSHSPPFQLTGATSYYVDVQGTIADGSDAVELQIVGPNGNFIQLATPIKFTKADLGGSKLTGVLPAGSTFRWLVPGSANNISTKITSSHG